MRVSVVINTYNRGKSLRNTLLGFRYQTYSDFEVVVVNGPSRDETEEVLKEFADSVRAYSCPDVHLSKSRNIGIAHASGDVVAFIDDDAIPEPNWIAELAAAYDNPEIGGAGGIVYDHSGVTFQYQYSVCSRIATTRFDIKPPFDAYNRPGADPFIYLQGTNCSFRRDLLVEIGGFNEEIEYYLDEVEVCMRGIDAGYQMASLPNAPVHHKYLPSHIRNQKRVVLDPYSTVKNHCTFAVRHGMQTRTFSEVMEEVTKYVNIVKAGGRANLDAQRMTHEQFEHYMRRTEDAMDFGVRQGLMKARPIRHLPPAPVDEFKPFPTLHPAGERLTICFMTREFPPACGGVGRYFADMAHGFAAAGHQVHVVTHSANGQHTVDFEDGVWMHRVADVQPRDEQFRQMPLCYNFTHVANVYHEVRRIHDLHGVDLAVGPMWLCEGAISQLDDRWPTVLSLQTSMKTIAGMGGTNTDAAQVAGMIALETATARSAKFIHGISHAILAKAREDFGPVTALGEHVVHIGTRDERHNVHRQRPKTARTRILFVGRIEARKGVDVLLKAAYEVLPEFPDAELVLVGKLNPSGNDNAIGEHERQMAVQPELRDRILFAGEKSDAEVLQAYADADIVVLPSRYESFGLVLTEGMMFGKPVVASRVGGMVEIVEHGGNGFFAEPEDPRSFAAAFRKLLGSAPLREQFGLRSRELFEKKFSTDVMVRNTLDCFRGVIKQWRSNGSGRTPDPDAVAERLKTLIRDAAGCSTEIAEVATKELLSKQFRAGGDSVRALQKLWHVPNEEFVRGLYDLILRRPADASGIRWFVAHLEADGDRRAIVEQFVTCDEAKSRGTDTSWLANFVPPPDPQAVVVAVQPVVPPPSKTFRQMVKATAKRVRAKLLSTPGVGKGLRMVKHAVVMPRTVRHLTGQNAEISAAIRALGSEMTATQGPALRQIRELQNQLSDRLAALEAQTSARHRQVHWMLEQQGQILDELMGDQDQTVKMPRSNNAAA
ncbi:glycosyltransferase [Limnoglobus roseus]|uniref:GT2 and GT4 families glycosyltransferase n=1 Tax=Limnoglobus roseus TaxID=2598579 RepID=A0A5C1A5S2_9BACT|nr:glycosyltransferase [Limnoglobus roseus]QEL14441.1 GT2 and GT4 families glycosyltransferase [Limnoglobus roseus]